MTDDDFCPHCEQSKDAEDLLDEAIEVLKRLPPAGECECRHARCLHYEAAAVLSRYDAAMGEDEEDEE